MDRNSLRTSVVIEVANQEEPEDQKTYHIDFDDLDIPKDYVIDQVFCGENITVYALFEVPEDANVSSNDHILDVTNPKAHDGYSFFQRHSSKKIMNERKLNGFKQNLLNPGESALNMLPNKDNGSGSFYCLKHLTGDYEMLTPERENSELKVLYSKSTVPRHSKSSKFKAVSKGVNTDIVQSPKIIQEVQKAVKQNIPFTKTEGKDGGYKTISSGKPSYEVIEMEMRQSFSSLSSYGDSRKPSKKSVPNFFLVPLLMMDDGVLSHFQSDDKMQQLAEEKGSKTVVPEMVSMGTNTDMLVLSPVLNETKQVENVIDVSPSESMKSGNSLQQKQSSGKLSSKNTILSEIKKLQGKLNALIKSIESDSVELDTSEPDSILEEPPAEKLEPSEPVLLSELKPFKPNWKRYDDLPILSTLTYPQCKTGRKKTRAETPSKEHKKEVVAIPTKSNSIGFLSGVGSSKSQITRTHSISNYHDYKSTDEMKQFSSNSSTVWSGLETRKSAGLSKSSTNGLSLLDPKLNLLNGLKKSLSFDLRDVKLEVTCLKKIKNTSFKLETIPNIRIPQKGEANMKCEMGDEACNKPKTSKIDLLGLSKPIAEAEDLKLEKKNLDPKKNLKEEEGDAKLVYSDKNLLTQMMARKTENIEVHFCNMINVTPKDNLLTAETPCHQRGGQPPKGVVNVVDTEQKVNPDLDKPTTPNKTCRRSTPPNGNPKKELKPVKKLNCQPNKIKMGDKIPKPEVREVSLQDTVKQRSVTGSRKFTLKGTAESKLHVDRLMKSENSVSPRAGVDRPRGSRLPCQKRESVDPPVIYEENREKTPKTNTPQNRNRDNDTVTALEKIGEDSGEDACENFEVSNQSGVVVELLSEKPSEKLCPDDNHNLVNAADGDVIIKENARSQHEDSENSLNPEKPVVKSVWALTKVLLFEDGSKKIEILEASLTPPGYSLPKIQPK